MPQLFRFGNYVIYFWSNENNPTESVHVHISEKRPVENGTKIWITRSGHTIVDNNASRIPSAKLRMLCRYVEANVDEVLEEWEKHFGEARFFC